jgi:hypothetical protein
MDLTMNGTDAVEQAPQEHPDDLTAVTPDHPTEAGPRPRWWNRRTTRRRSIERTDETPATAAAGPVERHPDAPALAAQTTPAPVVQSTTARRIAVALAVLLAGVIAVAFRGSWTAHSDAAKAAHFDSHGAWLYPFAPDGLIVLALVGAVVLRHKRWPSWYCLGVVTLFTLSSYTINHLHGLGMFEMVPGTGELVKALPGAVVGLIAGQLVGAIAFGSHILMHVFRHLFPEALDGVTETRGAAPAETISPAPVRPGSPAMSDPDPVQGAAPAPEIDGYELAKTIYAACLDGGVKLSQEKLSKIARISKRRAGYARVDVDNERAGETAEQGDDETPVAAPETTLAAPPKKIPALNGSAAASGPAGGEDR